MLKKLRFLIWLAQAFAKRHILTVIITTIATFFVILFAWRYISFVRKFFFKEQKTVGVVGQYTPTTLPRYIQEKISVGLTQLSLSQQVFPAAASSWEVIDDGKTYIFKIRNDLLWHDGEQFKASDVNYNFKDAKITPVNKDVLKITLKQPFSPLPSLLSKPLFRQGFIGLGPFRVSHLQSRGEFIKELKLEPLDPVSDSPETIKFYPTIRQAETAFELGEINILYTFEEQTELLEWKDYLKIQKEQNLNFYVTVLLRTDKPPFDQKLFRQALAYSIPNEITKGGINSPIPENSWAHNRTLKKIQYNKNKALELFEKSGVATQSANFTIYTFPNLLEVANKMRHGWEIFAVKANIKVVSSVPEDFSVLLTMQEVPRDPDQYSLWHSMQKYTNLTKFTNPKIDKLLEDGRKTFDPAKRKEYYDEFQRYLMDELPALFLYHPTTYTISRK